MNRIHRHDHDPVFPEGLTQARIPLPVAFEGEHLEVRYHRTGWRRLNVDFNTVKRRQTSALIVTDGQHVGSLEINEYRIATFTESGEFLEEMDAHSHATYNLADVICGNWEEVSEISDYGDIVELNRAWMSAAFSNARRFSAAANTLIDNLYRNRSLLILKAFPLEYEGKVAARNEASFLRRQKAMQRHYSRIFGVAPFPGADGRAGWMYSIPPHLSDIISQPSGRV